MNPLTSVKGAITAAVILAVVIVSVAALSLWYLLRPEPLLLQGEIDATRLDIAARVDVFEAIRQGLDDVRHGRTRPAKDVFNDIRRRHDIPR